MSLTARFRLSFSRLSFQRMRLCGPLLAVALATAAAIVPAPARAASLPPADPTGDLAICANESGATAIAACTRFIALNTTHGRGLALVYVMRATEHYGLHDYDAAIADADTAIRHDPMTDTAYAIRGVSRHEKGDFDAAIADFTEGLRIDPGESHFYEERGKSWLAKGDVARAMADFDTRIARAPREASGFLNRALAWKTMNDRNRAIADLDAAIALDPANRVAIRERDSLRTDRSTAVVPRIK